MDRKKLINIIVTVIIVLVILLVGAYGVMTSDFSKIKKYDEPDSTRTVRSNTPISKERKALAKQRYYTTKVQSTGDGIMSLGDFTMNLSNDRILTTNISLKYKDNDDSWLSSGKTKKEMLQKSVVLRNSVIDAMYTSEARTNNKRIKEAIRKDLNKHLSNGEVQEVYFNKFIIQ